MASVHVNIDMPSPVSQDRLFEILNEVALMYDEEYQLSTWHSWDVVSRATNAGDVGIAGLGRTFSRLMAGPESLASCLGVATHIFTDLQATLAHDSDLRSYGKTV